MSEVNLHFIMAIFSCCRLVELFAQDTIGAWFRHHLPKALISCVRCISVWCGLIATLLYVYFPWANWPFAFSMIFIHQSIIFSYIARKR